MRQEDLKVGQLVTVTETWTSRVKKTYSDGTVRFEGDPEEGYYWLRAHSDAEIELIHEWQAGDVALFDLSLGNPVRVRDAEGNWRNSNGEVMHREGAYNAPSGYTLIIRNGRVV